jgi:ubiquinone/menaquinone biosynthesis C-methylase UbiE
MSTELELKKIVQDKYSDIALQSATENKSSCCGATACCDELVTIMADDYSSLEGYNPDADLGLGCGLPTEFANIEEADTVIDLGSGAGNDAFIARKLTGDKGKVIGIDFTQTMIDKARANADKIGYTNMEFRLGDIENMPVADNTADVIVSNCVLNLVPNKQNVFNEIYRVLKPGAHFSISDIVLEGALPANMKQAAELYAGCVSGAIQKKEYLDIIHNAGFANVVLQKEKKISVPDEILQQYISNEELKKLNQETGIYSITVYAEKPAKDDRNCCTPGNGCC